jgi:hypothetical protein
VRAAKEAETVLAEETVMMAEALVDVALATTIATVDADNNNSRQQTTINNRLLGLGEKPCLAVVTTEVASWHRRCLFIKATKQRHRPSTRSDNINFTCLPPFCLV